jgi:integrase
MNCREPREWNRVRRRGRGGGTAGTPARQSCATTSRLAEALALAGKIEEGLAALDDALAKAAVSGVRGWDAEIHRLRGELTGRLPYPDPVRAEDSFHTALAIALIYSFARVSAALGMRVEDYFPQGKRWWLRLHEKGGKHHEMPVHHTLEEYLDSYIEAAGLLKEPKSPLFRASNGKTKILSDRPFERRDALKMVQRRAKAAGIKTKIGNHTFRATGITIYLTNGDLEKAQQMAAHESPRTTKLYDRRSDVVSLDEVEKVVF